MQKIINYLVILLIFTTILPTHYLCQNNFISIEYKNQLNMPTNLTKAIELDKVGFVWIATDAGLVKFDGQNFDVFTDNLPSQYIKDLVKLKNGEILIISDLGINKIISNQNTHKFENLVKGSTSRTDSTVFYPKTVYEDTANNLWISEPDAIVRLSDGKITRFLFDDSQRADSYFRSFLFVEDEYGNLLVCSQKGSVFIFNKYSNKFIKLYSFDEKKIRIDAFHKTSAGEILIGTNNGVFNIAYNLNFNDVKVNKIFKINDVSIIKNYNKNSILIGTWTNGLFLADSRTDHSKITELKFDNISNLMIDSNSNIWVSSDEGFALINEIFFSTFTLNSSSHYIENVSRTTNGDTFVSDGNSIFLIENKADKLKIENIYNKSESLILSVAGSKDNLWISYRDGFVEHKKNGQIVTTYLPQTESVNRLVRSIVIDYENNIWATEEGLKGIIKIDDLNKSKLYNHENGLDTYSQSIAKDKLGNLFVGGVGSNSFFYLYDKNEDKFINLSKTESTSKDSSIIVNEMAFDSNNNIWLGTNLGLYYREQNGETFKKIMLPEYPKLNIKSLAIDSKNRIWIGFEYGVLLINKGSISRFDNNDGLPNLTMTYRSAVIDKNDRLIIGTAHGLSYLEKNIHDKNVTNSPTITHIEVNNRFIDNNFSDLVIDNNSYLELSFITLTYPNYKVQYQWRLLGKNSTWSEPSYNTKLGLAQIETGEYKLQLRSQNTGYLWSQPTEILFSANKPWYQTFYAIILYLIIIILIILTSIHYLALLKEKRWIEQKIQLFFTLSSDLIVIIDPKGLMLFTNSILVNELPFSTEELKSVNYFSIFPEDERIKIKIEINQLLNDENTISFESKFIKKDKSISYYSWNFSISNDKKLLFGIGRDINEIMQMQSELAELNINKDKLFSLISHDLRSPFNSLLGYTKMMLDEFNSFSEDEIKEIVRMSYRASKKAFLLVDDLLSWSRLQMNKVTIIIEEVNLAELIDEELSSLEEQIIEKKIILDKKIINIVSNIDVNSYKIVFRNILSNAIKFSKPESKINITLEKIYDEIVLTISDNGIGINAEKLIKLKENNNHHSEYGTNGEKGSALGFELIHAYAALNNGKIFIDSKINKGTVVQFVISKLI